MWDYTVIKQGKFRQYCFQTDILGRDVTTAWGSVFISDLFNSCTFPEIFAALPSVQVTYYSSSGTCGVLVDSNLTVNHGPSMYLWRGKSGTSSGKVMITVTRFVA